MRLGITGKVTLLVIGVILALGLVLGAHVVTSQTRMLQAADANRAQALAENLAAGLERPMLTGDRAAMARLAERMLAQEGVVQCRVVDKAGAPVLVAGDTAARGPVREFTAAVSTERVSTPGAVLPAADEPALVDVVGMAYIAMSARDLDRTLAQTRRMLVLWLLAAVGAASALSAVVLRLMLGEPMARLAEATRRLTRGESDVMMPVEGHDEIGDLATAFNAMAAELQTSLVSRDYVDKIIDSMIDAVVVVDSADTITRVNGAAEKLLGCGAQEMVGHALGTLFHDGRSPHEVSHGRTTGLRLTNVAMTMRACDGAAVPVLFSSSAMTDAEGELRAVVCVAVDMRELHKAEEEIRKLSSAVEQSAQGVALATLEGTLTYANNAFVRMFGYDPAAVTGLAVARLQPQGDQRLATALEVAAGGGSWTGEVSVRTADDTVFPAYVSATMLRDSAGRPMAMLLHMSDISRQKELELQLQQAQKLESIGQLAGGIAHDFNNMLGAISGYADMIRQRYGASDQALEKYASRILDAARRSAELTSKLLAFARKVSPDKAAVDLHAVVQEVVGLLEHTIDPRIGIVRTLEAPHATVLGDRAQLQNAVLNLAVNARDAMARDGGTMTFESALVSSEAVPWRGQRPARVPGAWVRIAVVDTGVGMDENTRGRLFEPFFTTKPVGKGTGLGLASVYGTVQNHGGVIDVRTEVGKGSRFELYLPLADSAPSPAVPPARPPDRGKGVVMVVDDEELVREMACDMLGQAGYRAVSCRDGAEAIEYYRRHHTDIDLVVLDMVMPTVGGYECLLALKEINPRIRAIISSGYAVSDEAQRAMDAGARAFVPKPFEVEALTRAVSEALRG